MSLVVMYMSIMMCASSAALHGLLGVLGSRLHWAVDLGGRRGGSRLGIRDSNIGRGDMAVGARDDVAMSERLLLRVGQTSQRAPGGGCPSLVLNGHTCAAAEEVVECVASRGRSSTWQAARSPRLGCILSSTTRQPGL